MENGMDTQENETNCSKSKNEFYSFPTNLREHSLHYAMNNKERGLVIIFNHESYDMIDGQELNPRYGTNQDVRKLCTTFGKLGFKPDVHNNFTYAEIIGHCKTVSREPELNDYDCLIVFILTHGHEQETVYARDTKYNTKEVVELFVGDKCPQLHNKPKLFFIQACKGIRFQEKVNLRVEIDSGVMNNPAKCVMYSIPANSDVLISYATLEGFVAPRCPFNGSPYITQLCTELNMYGKTRDLLSTLIHVHHTLASKKFIMYDTEKKEDVEIKVQPSFLCYLNRFLIFDEQRPFVPHSQ